MKAHRSNRRKARPRPARGFTLLELIIVLAVIGILASMAMPNLIQVPRRADEAVLKNNLAVIRNVLDQHNGDKGYYPASLEALVDEGYLRTVPRDTIADTFEWELVYEEFDPDFEPAETDFPEDAAPGVIDVHSTSEDESLDGSFYNEW